MKVISRLPDYLVIHLKRFDFNLETLQNEKLNHRLEFSRELDLAKCAQRLGHPRGPPSPVDTAAVCIRAGWYMMLR